MKEKYLKRRKESSKLDNMLKILYVSSHFREMKLNEYKPPDWENKEQIEKVCTTSFV